MKLSDGEKIIIHMLADIQKALKIKDGFADRVMTAISGGHLWSLKWDSDLFHDHEYSETVVKETCNILHMWRVIEESYEQLDDGGKKTVQDANNGFVPKFSGFDANNDDHYGVARHLIEEMDRYECFKGRKLNSHCPLMPFYHKMYEAFEPICKASAMRRNFDLTVDEMVTIFEAA